MSEERDRRRRLAERRYNERLRLSANTINALAIGIAGAAIVIPGVADMGAVMTWQSALWLFVAVALHCIALGVIAQIRSEE